MQRFRIFAKKLELSSASLRNWNDGMLERWNDGMALFGQINAYGGDHSLLSP
jgi:hypothetical protein